MKKVFCNYHGIEIPVEKHTGTFCFGCAEPCKGAGIRASECPGCCAPTRAPGVYCPECQKNNPDCREKVVNLTPHPISIADGQGKILVTYPASGIQARVAVSQEQVDTIAGIPAMRQVYGDVEGLPEPVERTIYIVSILVFGVSGRTDIIAPDTGKTAVRDNEGKILAVRQWIAK